MLPPSTGLAVFGTVIDAGWLGHGVMRTVPERRSAVTSARQLAPSSTTAQSSVGKPGVQSLPPPEVSVGAPLGATAWCAASRSAPGPGARWPAAVSGDVEPFRNTE